MVFSLDLTWIPYWLPTHANYFPHATSFPSSSYLPCRWQRVGPASSRCTSPPLYPRTLWGARTLCRPRSPRATRTRLEYCASAARQKERAWLSYDIYTYAFSLADVENSQTHTDPSIPSIRVLVGGFMASTIFQCYLFRIIRIVNSNARLIDLKMLYSNIHNHIVLKYIFKISQCNLKRSKTDTQCTISHKKGPRMSKCEDDNESNNLRV